MARWQRTIRLNPEWDQAQTGEITVQKMAAAIVMRLRALKDFGGEDADLDDSRSEIADEFEAISEDPSASNDEFDYVMRSLYDWGDQSIDGEWSGKKACWIDTITTGGSV